MTLANVTQKKIQGYHGLARLRRWQGLTSVPRAKGTGRIGDNTKTNQPCTRYDRLPIAGKSIMAERPENGFAHPCKWIKLSED